MFEACRCTGWERSWCGAPWWRSCRVRTTGLERGGLTASIGRAGFQAHDGHIYETLVERGGILVAVHNLPRAADALAKLHAYGGGNAAIGAWAGRTKTVQFR